MDEEFEKFDKKIWRTIGARFNAYRRLQRRQNASIFSISILSLYLVFEAFIPSGTLPPELENWRKSLVVMSAIFILILSLLEARKSYELKAERLHKNAMELNSLYDSFKVSSDNKEKKEKIGMYHVLITLCPENHEPCDEALFRASHGDEFGIGQKKSIYIKLQNFIQTYWLYASLVFVPPFTVAVALICSS